ncbi:O-antigen ligase family protein [Vibrio sp. WJH972]
MSRTERFCFYNLLALLVFLPLPLASHRPWAWSLFESWIAVITLLTLYSYREHFPWKRVKRYLWLLVPLALFQVWVLLQIIPIPSSLLAIISPNASEVYQLVGSTSFTISLDRYATLSGLLKGVAYTLFAFNAVILVNSISRIKLVLYTIVISGTFQAFYGALEVLLHTDISWIFGLEQGNRANGTFVYHNHFANYLMMSLCIGTGLIISQLHQTPSGSWNVRLNRWTSAMMSTKMIVRLCLVVMVIALVMTRSRMGNSAFFSVTVIGGIIAMIFYKNRPRALTVMIISLIAIDTLVVGTVFGLSKVKDRLEATSAQAETRDQVVEWSMDIIKDYPVTGTGMGSFYSTFPSYSHYNIGYYDFAHNDYIQFIVEAGVPATLVLGSAVLWAIWLSLKAIRKRNSKTLKGTALGALMAIVGMLIHITVDFNLQPPANAVMFIMILVLAGASSSLPVVKNNKVEP